MAASKHKSRTATADSPQLARRYTRGCGWLLRDGLRDAEWSALLVGVTRAAGLALGGATVGAIVLFARQAATGEVPEVPLIDVSLERKGTLALLGLVAITAGLLSAGTTLLSDFIAYGIARRYQTRVTKRVIRAACRTDAADLLDEASIVAGRPLDPAQLAIVSSRTSAFALRAMVQGLLPAAACVATAGFLAWSQPALTGILMILAVLYVVPLYRINRTVARHYKHYRMLGPQVMGGIRRTVATQMAVDGPLRDERVWGRALVDNEGYRAAQHALYGRRFAAAKLRGLNFLLLVAGLVAVVYSAAASAANEQDAWTGLAVYLMAIQIAWNGLREATAQAVTVSRFFPSFEDLVDFLRVVERANAGSAASDKPIAFPVTLDVPRPSGDPSPPSRLALAPGRAILVASSEQGSPWFRPAEKILRRALMDVEPGSLRLIPLDRRPLLPGLTPLDHAVAGDASDDELAALDEHLSRLGVSSELSGLPEALHTPLSETQVGALSAEAGLALASFPFRAMPAGVVVMRAAGLRPLGAEFQRALLDGMTQHAVVLVDTWPPVILHPNLEVVRERAEAVILAREGEIAGGSMAWLAASVPADAVAASDLIADDDASRSNDDCDADEDDA